MERVRRVFAVTAALLLLSHCHKAAPPAPEDAGTAAPPPPPPTAPVPPSLASFEGEIDLVAKSADASKPSQSVNVLVRNDRVRVDAPPGSEVAKAVGGKAFMLLRVPDKKLDVVMESSKQVIELDFNNTDHLKNLAKSQASRSPKGEHAPPEPPPKFTKTGQKDTIAGYTCEDWEIASGKDGRKKATMCVAEVGVSFFHLPIPATGVPTEYAFALELVDGQHLPLRVIGYDDKTGAESGRVEITKFDRHPLDASLFEVPAGYTTVDAMQMLAGFAAGRMPGMPPGMPGIPSGIPGMPPGGLPGAPAHHKHH